jgi:RNA polymerase sigma-70 factor (ECF subfamily)
MSRPAPHLSIVSEAAPLAARSDDELMALAASGVVEAFGVLVARYESRVRGYCAKLCGSRSIGDEVAQECFLRLWRVRLSYAQRGQFKPYLFRLVENRCKNENRSRSRRREVAGVALDAESGTCDQHEQLLLAQRHAEVQRGLERLPEAQRRAIVLRFTAGLEYDEIAAIVGRSAPTVRTRVFHGIARLRELLTRGGAR